MCTCMIALPILRLDVMQKSRVLCLIISYNVHAHDVLPTLHTLM